MDVSIAEATSKCLKAYETVQRQVSHNGPLSYKISAQLQSIKVWARHMSVHDEACSLDYQIGDADEIRSLFVQLLQAIGSLNAEGVSDSESQNSDDAHQRADTPDQNALQTNDHLESDAQSTSASSTSSDLSESTKQEFGAVSEPDYNPISWLSRIGNRVKQNDGFISHLQRLSNAVRAASGESRVARVNAWWHTVTSMCAEQTQTAQEPQLTTAQSCVKDIVLFRSSVEALLRIRFPECPDWLRDRLLESMIYRRKRCLYLLTKEASRLVRPSTKQTAKVFAQPALPGPQPEMSEPVRDRIVQFNLPQPQDTPANSAPTPSIVTRINKKAFKPPPSTIFSTKTSASAIDDDDIAVPPCPGNPFSNEDFTCPYCNFILPYSMALPRKWRYHVIQDLEPYICIRETCPCPGVLYSTSEDWLDHMKSLHDFRWVCSGQAHAELIFENEIEYQQHVTSRHNEGKVDKDLLQLLSRVNRIEDPDAFSQCPLCGLDNGTSQHETHAETQHDVRTDIVAHLRQLAVLSLVTTQAELVFDASPTSSISSNDRQSGCNLTFRSSRPSVGSQIALSVTDDDTQTITSEVSDEVFQTPPDSGEIFSAKSHFASNEELVGAREHNMRDVLDQHVRFVWPGHEGRLDSNYWFQEGESIHRILMFEESSFISLEALKSDRQQYAVQPHDGQYDDKTVCNGRWRIRPEAQVTTELTSEFRASFYVTRLIRTTTSQELSGLVSRVAPMPELIRHPHLSYVLGTFLLDRRLYALEYPVGDCSLEALLCHVSNRIGNDHYVKALEQLPFELCPLSNKSLASLLKLLLRATFCLSQALEMHSSRSRIVDHKTRTITYVLSPYLDPSNIVISSEQSVVIRWLAASLNTQVSTLKAPIFDQYERDAEIHPQYRPPEGYDRNIMMEAAEKAVIWSLGCILLRILTLVLGRTLDQFDRFLRGYQSFGSRAWSTEKQSLRCHVCGYDSHAPRCLYCGNELVEVIRDPHPPDIQPIVYAECIDALSSWLDELVEEATERAKALKILLKVNASEISAALDTVRLMLDRDPSSRPVLRDLWMNFDFSGIDNCPDCHPESSNPWSPIDINRLSYARYGVSGITYTEKSDAEFELEEDSLSLSEGSVREQAAGPEPSMYVPTGEGADIDQINDTDDTDDIDAIASYLPNRLETIIASHQPHLLDTISEIDDDDDATTAAAGIGSKIQEKGDSAKVQDKIENRTVDEEKDNYAPSPYSVPTNTRPAGATAAMVSTINKNFLYFIFTRADNAKWDTEPIVEHIPAAQADIQRKSETQSKHGPAIQQLQRMGHNRRGQIDRFVRTLNSTETDGSLWEVIWLDDTKEQIRGKTVEVLAFQMIVARNPPTKASLLDLEETYVDPFTGNFVKVPRKEFRVRALRDFSGHRPNELHFKKDNVIHNVELSGVEHWWRGSLQGCSGIFPNNYVETVTTLAQVIALWDWVPSEPDELHFKRGDVIDVINYDNEDWYTGCLQGRIGFFPANHVRVLEGGFVAESPQQDQLTASHGALSSERENSPESPSRVASAIKAHESNPSASGSKQVQLTEPVDTAQSDLVRSTVAEARKLTNFRLKEVLRNEDLLLSGTKSELQIRLITHLEQCAASGEHESVNRIRESIRGVSESSPNTSLPRLPPTILSDGYYRVRALRDFASSEPDGLKFEVGDIITDVELSSDPGLWEGQLRGLTGTFPANYVEVVADNLDEAKGDVEARQDDLEAGYIGEGRDNPDESRPSQQESSSSSRFRWSDLSQSEKEECRGPEMLSGPKVVAGLDGPKLRFYRIYGRLQDEWYTTIQPALRAVLQKLDDQGRKRCSIGCLLGQSQQPNGLRPYILLRSRDAKSRSILRFESILQQNFLVQDLSARILRVEDTIRLL